MLFFSFFLYLVIYFFSLFCFFFLSFFLLSFLCMDILVVKNRKKGKIYVVTNSWSWWYCTMIPKCQLKKKKLSVTCVCLCAPDTCALWGLIIVAFVLKYYMWACILFWAVGSRPAQFGLFYLVFCVQRGLVVARLTYFVQWYWT